MKEFDLKLFAIQEGNEWFRAGWNALVDCYREHQFDIQNRHADFDPKVARSRRAYQASLETLGRVTAGVLGVPYEPLGSDEDAMVYVALKGYLWETCGLPASPKGLDAWRET